MDGGELRLDFFDWQQAWTLHMDYVAFAKQMVRAVEAGAQHSAFALALAFPDICGSIEYPSEPRVSVRYRD
jgi:hypothetical protein